MLSFPEVARWWIEKVFPLERQILAAAGPLARALLDVPLPGTPCSPTCSGSPSS